MSWKRPLRRFYGKFFDPYDYSTHVFRFPDYRLIYIAVPKVANSSIKATLTELFPSEVRTKHPDPNRPRAVYRSGRDILFREGARIYKHQVCRHPSYKVIAFVRNPWDRLVSCYKDKVTEGSVTESGRPKVREDRALYENTAIQREMDFGEFVREVAKTPDTKANRHFRSQYTFLTDRRGRLLPTDIGYFERLSGDFGRMMADIGAPEVSLPRLRYTSSSDYREFYTPDLRRIVAERYERDVAQFGYSF